MNQAIQVNHFQEMIDHYGHTKTGQIEQYNIQRRIPETTVNGELEYLELAPKRIRIDEADLPRQILKVECQRYQNMLSWWSLDQKSAFIRDQVTQNILSSFSFSRLGINFSEGVFYDLENQNYGLFERLSGLWIDDLSYYDWQKVIYSAGEVLGKLHSQSWSNIEDNIPLTYFNSLGHLNNLELDSVFDLYAKALRDINYQGEVFAGMDNLRYQFQLLYEELGFLPRENTKGYYNDPQVFVHGDFNLSNLLVDSRTKKVHAVIGWKESGYGSPVADWVNIYLNLIDYGLGDPMIMKWFMKGYRKYCHPDIYILVDNHMKFLRLWARLMAYGMETINQWVNSSPTRKERYSRWIPLVKN